MKLNIPPKCQFSFTLLITVFIIGGETSRSFSPVFFEYLTSKRGYDCSNESAVIKISSNKEFELGLLKPAELL